jgi:peptide/nickel transport system substrate-binding protein
MFQDQKRNWFALISILVVVGMLLSACSTSASPTSAGTEITEPASDEEATESVVDPTASAETANATEVAEPPVGGTLVIGLKSEPDTLDPDFTTMGLILDYTGVALIAKDKDNQYVPWAAESWEVSSDGLTYTFTLRTDMKFQDGSPLTAKDFAYTYTRALDPSSTGATSQMLAGVVEVTATDDYTLIMTLSAPNFYLLDNLTLVDYMQPVSEAWVTSQGDALSHNPISSGPYMLKEYVTGDHVTLERNPDYTWAPSYAHQGPADIQEIIFRFIPDISTMLAGLEAGEIDYLSGLDVQYVSRLEDLETFNILEGAYPGTNPYLSINTQKAPVDDEKVRQAIGYAIDREAIIEVVLQGKGTIQAGPLSPSMTGYWSGIEDIGFTYDVEKAKSLLAEAGYSLNADGIMAKGDQVLQLDLLTSADYIKHAQMIQEQLRQVGIEINIVQEELSLMVTDLIQGNYSLALFTYGYSNGGILPMIFHSRMEGVMNPGHVNDPDLDTLLDEINSETDPTQQQEALNQAQELIIEKAYMIPLVNPTTYNALSSKVMGYTFSTSNNILYLEDAYIQQ